MSTAPIPNFGLASFGAAGSYTYDPLLSDGHHVVSRMGSVAAGSAKLVRGTIVNFAPATGYVLPNPLVAACNAVVAENVDPTGATGRVDCLVYVSGKMKADAIIWPSAGTHAEIADNLRDYGILLESVLFRDGAIVKSAPTADQESKAKERIEDNRKRGTKEPDGKLDLEGDIQDSSWGYLSAEDREKNPELAAPAPLGSEEAEEADRKERERTGGIKEKVPEKPGEKRAERREDRPSSPPPTKR